MNNLAKLVSPTALLYILVVVTQITVGIYQAGRIGLLLILAFLGINVGAAAVGGGLYFLVALSTRRVAIG